MNRPLSAIVCGTGFGQVYLEAFRTPELPVRLAGILARGSDRSRACAEHYQVPLYTDPDEVPADVDLACVVVRGGLLGGHGSDLACRLMAHGLHVLQEHPVHHDELAQCLRAARAHRVAYRLTAFYPHLEPVRRFLGAARELLDRRRATYLDATCGFQVGYALLDILATAVGRIQPASLVTGPDGDSPFRTLTGVVGGVPATVRIQHQLDPADPDGGALLLHRITLGSDAGDLTLVSTTGPLVFAARPRIPSQARAPSAEPLFASWIGDRHETPYWTLLGPLCGPEHATVFGSLWPRAAAYTVAQFADEIATGADPLRAGAHHLELCKLWQAMAAALGTPAAVGRDVWQPLSARDHEALAAAVAA